MYFLLNTAVVPKPSKSKTNWDACLFDDVLEGGNPFAKQTLYEISITATAKIPNDIVHTPYQRVPSPYQAMLYVEGGGELPKLASFQSSSRVRAPTPGWRNALKTGEIVVAPMTTSKLIMVDTLVPKVGAVPSTTRTTYFNRKALPTTTRCGRDASVLPDGSYELRALCPPVDVTEQNSSTLYTYYFGYASLDDLESVYGNSLSQAFVDNVAVNLNTYVQSSSFDESIVTACVAETRSGTYDLLTDLAEMPETLLMIMQLVQRILGSYTDTLARVAKLEKLSKALEKAEKRAKKAKRSGKPPVTPNPKSELAGKTADSLTKEIASEWLLYRYGIGPALMSLSNAIELITKGTHEYGKFRKTTTDIIDIDLGDLKLHSVPVTTRAFGKLRVDGPLAGLKLNPISSSLEVVPLSLLLNWVMNIGDCLTALVPAPGTVQEVYSVSRSVPEGTYSGTFRGKPISVAYGYYKLDLISPEANINLKFANFMSWKRTLDAFALSYAPLRKALIGLKT